MSIKKPWILVTGGTRGIGRGLVEGLSAGGYDVVFTYLKSAREADDIERSVEESGNFARGYRCDGCNAEEVEALVKDLVVQFGPPHALINNAGITDDGLLYNMSEASWDSVISNNLKSCFLFSKSVLPSMMERRDGAIVNMSSVTAVKGNVGQVNYAATKAAMIGMTKTLALEVGRFNIRVNSILPGLVETEMIRKIPEQELKNIKKGIPLRRLCGVAEIEKLVRYLVSSDASYITAQSLSIDGGLTA